MTMSEIPALLAGVFLGALVSGFSGFAFSAVCGAILIHVFQPNEAIPLMMACSIASQLLAMMTLRRSLRFSTETCLICGGAVGVAAAVLVIAWIEPRMLRWFFGAFLAAYAAYLLVRTPAERWTARGPLPQTLVGTFGGAVGVFTAMPGAIPSIWCEMRGCTKEEQRGLVQPFIVAMQLIALALFLLTPAGIPKQLPYYFALSLPALCFGSWLGTVAFRHVNDRAFRKAILVMLIVSGLLMLR